MFRKLAAIGAAALVVGAGAGAAIAAGNPGAPGQVAGTCVPKLDGTGPRAAGTGVCQPKRDGTGPAYGERGAGPGHGYRAGLRIHATP